MVFQRHAELQRFAKINEMPYNSLDFLALALIHKSYANENDPSYLKQAPTTHNQRLEFLIVAEALYEKYPFSDEGILTKKKAQAVCESTLAKIGNEMRLGEYILFGRGSLVPEGLSSPRT